MFFDIKLLKNTHKYPPPVWIFRCENDMAIRKLGVFAIVGEEI